MTDYKNIGRPHLPRKEQYDIGGNFILGIIFMLLFFLMLGLAGNEDYKAAQTIDKQTVLENMKRQHEVNTADLYRHYSERSK